MENILFCHIPKTAGTNINYNLSNKENCNYNYYCHYILKYDIHNYKQFYKFSIIRDPIKKVVSVYFYTIKMINNLIKRKSLKDYQLGNWNKLYNIYKKYNINSIFDYLNNYTNIYYDVIFPKINKLKFYNKNYKMEFYYIVLFLPQYLFICDDNDKILVDDVFNINNLKVVSEKFNIDLNTNKLNNSKSSDFNIEQINENIIKKIKYIYKKDYEIFNF